MIFLKNVGLYSLGQGAAAVLGFFYMVVTARMLGVSDYGLFQAMLGIYGISAIFTFPLNLASLHCVSVTSEDQRPQVSGEFVYLALIVSGACTAILLLLSPLLIRTLQAETIFPFILTGLLIMATGLITVIFGVLQGMERYKEFSLARAIQSFICLILGVGLMSLRWGVTGAVAGYALSMGITFLYFVIQPQYCVLKTGFSHVKKELASIIWIVIVLALILSVENIPIIVGRATLAPVESGIYGAIHNLRHIIWPFAFAVSLPMYSSLLNNPGDKKTLRHALFLTLGLGGIFIVGALFFPSLIIKTLYGEEYIKAANYFMLYGIALLLQMLFMIFTFYHVAKKSMKIYYLLFPPIIFISMLLLYNTSITGLICAQIATSLTFFIAWLLNDFARMLFGRGKTI